MRTFDSLSLQDIFREHSFELSALLHGMIEVTSVDPSITVLSSQY